MKALMFVKIRRSIGSELNETYLFKRDTFWSKSALPSGAKVYSDDNPIWVDEWLKDGILPYSIKKDKIENFIETYNGSILGYFTPDESNFNIHQIKEGTTIEDLGEPKFLWVMNLNPESDWTFSERDSSLRISPDSVYPDKDSIGYFESFKEHHRNELLNNLV